MTATKLTVLQFFVLIQFLPTQPMVSVAELVQKVSNKLITHKLRQAYKYIRKSFYLYEVQCSLIRANILIRTGLLSASDVNSTDNNQP